MNKTSKCPICGIEISDSVGYLANMSLSGKLFGYLPSFIGKLVPLSSVRTRFAHGRKMISVFSGHAWHYCVDCNFSYVYPQVTTEKLDDYYSVDFWSVRAATELKEMVFAPDNTDRPTYQLQFLKENGLTKVNSMLDFGAGMCGAPAVFKNAKFCNNVTILDKSSQAKAIAALLEIKQINELTDENAGPFELLYSSHSLEHVQDIHDTLKGFHAKVKEGGYLFIEVPNIANRTVLAWAHHAPHTYNFSEESLCKALKLHGFERIASSVYGVMVQDRIQHKDKALEVPDVIMALFKKSAN